MSSVTHQALTSSPCLSRLLALLLVSILMLSGRVHLLDPIEPWTPEPEFLKGPEEITVREGERAILPCGIYNLGTKQVSWKRIDEEHFVAIGDIKLKHDEAIKLNTSADQMTDITHWDLVFEPAKPQHTGVYECQISAKQKHSRFITLRVVGPPVTQTLKPSLILSGEKYVELGQKISLTCTAYNGPYEHQDIDWFKDGDKLVSDSRRGVVITKYNSATTKALISELLIDHSRVADTGTYICRSATDDIDSLKVTVLNADTNNVKREHDPDNGNQNLPMFVYGGGNDWSISRFQRTILLLSSLISLYLYWFKWFR